MRRFMHGSDEDWLALEARAVRSCVSFRCAMPPGSAPPQARVGFEMTPTGEALLLVDRGHYHGRQPCVRDWLTSGTRSFPTMAALRAWVCAELRDAYHEGPLPLAPAAVVDVDEVTTRLGRRTADAGVDEDALFDRLGLRVRGQDPALRAVAARVARHTVRRQPRRPLSMLFIGPTGVGKTETAEALADALAEHGTDVSQLRIDLNEFAEGHRVSGLLGAPPGYLGHGDPVPLLATLRAAPASVVIFDEVDKAHPSVVRTLMQALDRGGLGTSTGGRVDCRRAIFVFTSNAQGDELVADLASRPGLDELGIDAACRARLLGADVAPELVGRLGLCAAFVPPDPRARVEILTLALTTVASEYGVDLACVDPAVVVELLGERARAELGARPDAYVVDHHLGRLFAQAARAGGAGPWALREGPPVRCEPLVIPDYGPEPEEGD